MESTTERREEIVRRVLGRGEARVAELARALGVHEMTIRRDLERLEAEGRLRRIHGRAVPPPHPSAELSHLLRRTQNVAAKAAIAEAALRFVSPGETIALDSSTTCAALARQLGGMGVRAIVTGLEAAEGLAAAGVPFLLAGGEYHAASRSFVGEETVAFLRRLRPDRAFFSAHGLASEAGFSDPYLPEVAVKRALIRGAPWRCALLDGTKLGRVALGQIAPAEEVTTVVSDAPSPSFMRGEDWVSAGSPSGSREFDGCD